jgi:hypothetical protein
MLIHRLLLRLPPESPRRLGAAPETTSGAATI